MNPVASCACPATLCRVKTGFIVPRGTKSHNRAIGSYNKPERGITADDGAIASHGRVEMKPLREALEDALGARPFQPIEVVLKDGRRFEVRHPEALAVPTGDQAGEIMTPDGETHAFDVAQLVSVRRLQMSSPGGPGRAS